MSVDTETLADFSGKDVNLYLVGQEGFIEGHVEQASPAGIAFKRKGRRDIEPFFPPDIDRLEIRTKDNAKVQQKKHLPIPPEKVKTHLAQAHAVPLSTVNKYTEDEAVKAHNAIDHSDLWHNHDKVAKDESKSETPASE